MWLVGVGMGMGGDGRLRNLLLYYLLRAVREMGVSLPLLLRRTAQMASNDIEYLSKEFFGGNINVGDFNAIADSILQIMKNEGLIEDFKINELGTSGIDLEIKGCEYLNLVSEARAKGEAECPLCLIALTGAIAAATIKDSVNFNEVITETDTNNKICKLKLSFVVV